jgi:hypothetical protein
LLEGGMEEQHTLIRVTAFREGRRVRARGASTIRAKFQVAPLNVLKLVDLSRLSHVDFRSGFGTVFQGVLWVFALRRDY